MKRERNRSFRAKLAAAVDAELESMLASFRDAWLAGDWRAAQALMHEAYGLPLQRTEGDTTVSIVVQSVLDDDDDDLELERGATVVLPPGE